MRNNNDIHLIQIIYCIILYSSHPVFSHGSHLDTCSSTVNSHVHRLFSKTNMPGIF